MKKTVGILLATAFVLGLAGCSHSMSEPEPKKVERPQNIDENNVGVTSGEKADQTDPTLIEGNLEDNDLKN